jgi:CRISPR-associated protein Cas6
VTQNIPEMIDITFDLGGGVLPADYAFALWEALIHHEPLLAEQVGVLPIRATENEQGLLFSRRSKLVLRLPLTLASTASALCGLNLSPAVEMRLGKSRLRTILPFATLHSQLVEGCQDEALFLEGIHAQLHELGISGRVICGLRRTLGGKMHAIQGYSLVIHDLNPDASLRLQYAGLGQYRQFGCGIFVPFKIISL